VAENRLIAGVQKGCGEAGVKRQRGVTQGIDARMDSMKPARCDPPGYRAVTDANRFQLAAAHHPELPAGQVRQAF
jgi:hypothetical protein